MSLEKVRKYLKEVKHNEEDCLFIPDHLVGLIIAVAEHVLSDPTQEISCIPEGYIRARDFCRQQHWINQSTLNRYCNHDEDFSTKCAFKKGKKWYIHPAKVAAYFQEVSHWKPRLSRYSK